MRHISVKYHPNISHISVICKQLKFTLFCCKISWLAVYAVLLQNLFCRDFCVEKIFSQKCAMWRKNDKYDVWTGLGVF